MIASQDNHPALQSGQVLGDRYRLQKRLGHTATSRQTWLALDTHRHNEPIALKLLAFHPHMQLEELKLFEREAEVLQTLDHPRIPDYRDYFSDERDVLWFGLVQEYIPGKSLQARLEQGQTFAEEDVRWLATRVLTILFHLHARVPPVLHRDIKPSNILWGDDKEIYLIDFGAVQTQAALTGVTFTVVGSCGYAPLEQFWGRAVPSSDLYALGATLMHLLSGIPPADLPQSNGYLHLPDNVTIQPFFKAWIEKLVEPIQEKRFASTKQALQSLAQEHFPSADVPNDRLQKPKGSRIRLQRRSDRCSILVPSQTQDNIADFLVGVLLIALMLGVLLLSLGALWMLFFGSNTMGLLVFNFILLGVFGSLLMRVTEETQIELEGNSFFLQRASFFGLSSNQRKLSRPSILSIFLQRISERNRIGIRLQHETIYLGWGLTEMECIWLVQELQDWLHE
ncbi:MAG: serine/threonine-protein kinase [Cyanobacteria bacterium J06638_20]